MCECIFFNCTAMHMYMYMQLKKVEYFCTNWLLLIPFEYLLVYHTQFKKVTLINLLAVGLNTVYPLNIQFIHSNTMLDMQDWLYKYNARYAGLGVMPSPDSNNNNTIVFQWYM